MRLSVSATASKASAPSATAVAVRQTPLIETESPTAVRAAVVGRLDPEPDAVRVALDRGDPAALPDDPGEHGTKATRAVTKSTRSRHPWVRNSSIRVENDGRGHGASPGAA